MVSTQRMEKVLHKVRSNFLIQIQGLQMMEPKEIEDPNLPPLLVEFSYVFAKSKGLSLTRLHDHHKFVKDDDKISTLSRGCQKDALLWPSETIAIFSALMIAMPSTPVIAILSKCS
ncbi:hypothetical protein GW17_00029733 [Ensete ventricosum]|nr:hypothetical protein GW17_00029733 [Ensete ventricosum]